MSEESVEIRKAAMDLLARREHSRQELQRKLEKKFEEDGRVSAELEALAEEGLQSDLRFAEAFLRSRAGRGYGPVRIRQEMSSRGLAEQDIEQAFEANDIDWLTNLRQVAERKYGKAPAEDYKEKARRARFLQYRGFTAEQIREVL